MTTHPHSDQCYKFVGNNVVVSKQLHVQEALKIGGSKTTPTGESGSAYLYYNSADDTLDVKVNGDTAHTLTGSKLVIIGVGAPNPYNVTASQSGTTFMLAHSSGNNVNLPAPKAGLRYKFIASNVTSDHTISTSSNLIHGLISSPDKDGDAAATNGTAVDLITFDQSGGVKAGDYVELISDGTNWFVSGMTTVYTGITLS